MCILLLPLYISLSKLTSKSTSLIVLLIVDFDKVNSSYKCSPTSLYDMIEARSNIFRISSFVIRLNFGRFNLLSSK